MHTLSFEDDDNNNKECDWDGGDCCDNLGSKQFQYCEKCECKDPNKKAKTPACLLPAYKGDGFCDDQNNKPSCLYDGGDCCGKSGKKNQNQYCKECKCKDPNYKPSVCLKKFIGDKFCDDQNNVKECNYDGGDCCSQHHANQFQHCDKCECVDPDHHKENAGKCGAKCGASDFKGDGFCDDDNNSCGCNWDGGDCCGNSGKSKQMLYCHKCACLDPDFKPVAEDECELPEYKGDGFCDDGNNHDGCEWDGGDCCGKTGKFHQFKYCKLCQCIGKKKK